VSRSRSARGVWVCLVLTPVALAWALTYGAKSAHAGLGISCPSATSQPFKTWSDYAQYVLVPDGGFESGASEWILAGGAKVVSGNEPFYIRGSKSDRRSLLLPAGAQATTPPMCISLLSSKMRFVVGGTAGSTVKVQVLYRGALSSLLGIFDGGTVSSSGKWTPSPEISMLGGVLPLLTQSVQFRLVATSGAVQVDDAYLDPWKLG
jgi:hypothetical protein